MAQSLMIQTGTVSIRVLSWLHRLYVHEYGSVCCFRIYLYYTHYISADNDVTDVSQKHAGVTVYGHSQPNVTVYRQLNMVEI
jgi:hypothetical protein